MNGSQQLILTTRVPLRLGAARRMMKVSFFTAVMVDLCRLFYVQIAPNGPCGLLHSYKGNAVPLIQNLAKKKKKRDEEKMHQPNFHSPRPLTRFKKFTPSILSPSPIFSLLPSTKHTDHSSSRDERGLTTSFAREQAREPPRATHMDLSRCRLRDHHRRPR